MKPLIVWSCPPCGDASIGSNVAFLFSRAWSREPPGFVLRGAGSPQGVAPRHVRAPPPDDELSMALGSGPTQPKLQRLGRMGALLLLVGASMGCDPGWFGTCAMARGGSARRDGPVCGSNRPLRAQASSVCACPASAVQGGKRILAFAWPRSQPLARQKTERARRWARRGQGSAATCPKWIRRANKPAPHDMH